MAVCYEFQIEVTNNEGSIEDPNVFLVIENGKVLPEMLIPNNFVKDYLTKIQSLLINFVDSQLIQIFLN